MRGFWDSHRVRRRRPLDFTTLEDRRLPSVNAVTAAADPRFLAPAPRRPVPVTVTGTVTQEIDYRLPGRPTVPPPAQELAAIDAYNAARPAPGPVLAQVTDAYRRVEPRARAPLQWVESKTFFRPATRFNPTAVVGLIRTYSYAFTLYVQATTSGNSPRGRQYVINVSSADPEGTGQQTIAVLVTPAAARRPSGYRSVPTRS